MNCKVHIQVELWIGLQLILENHVVSSMYGKPYWKYFSIVIINFEAAEIAKAMVKTVRTQITSHFVQTDQRFSSMPYNPWFVSVKVYITAWYGNSSRGTLVANTLIFANFHHSSTIVDKYMYFQHSLPKFATFNMI